MKCIRISKASPSDRKKREMNSDPRSQVTWFRTPCLEKTCVTKIRASCSEVQEMVVGVNIACLENLSTTTRMESEPSESGRDLIKSIEIESQGRGGIGSCWRMP